MRFSLFFFLGLSLSSAVLADMARPVTQNSTTKAITDDLATGPHGFKISAAGNLVWENGAGFTGASYFRTAAGLTIGTNVQAYDADLTTYAGITPSPNVQSLLGAADYAAMRTALGLVIGTNVQAYDADLTTYAGITPSANVQSLLGAADYAAMRTALGLVIGTNVQAYDADLTTYAGITPGSGVSDWLGSPTEANLKAATAGIEWLDTRGNISVASAVSAPARHYTGAWYAAGTGTTNLPHVLIEPTGTTASTTWDTAGTAFGINGSSGTLFDVKTNGVGAGDYTPNSNFKIMADGGVWFGAYKMLGTNYGGCLAYGNLHYTRGAGINFYNESSLSFNFDSYIFSAPYTGSSITGVLHLNGVNSTEELRISANGGSNIGSYLGLKFDGTDGVISSTGLVTITSPIGIPSGTNARAGNATLTAGSIIVLNATVTTNTLVILTRKTAGGTIGNLTYTTAGGGFTISSDSATDTSTVSYLLIENP